VLLSQKAAPGAALLLLLLLLPLHPQPAQQ
jgi:hypothetical protein